MKKLLLAVLVAVFVSAGVSAGSVSAVQPPQTDVTGVITESQAAVAGASVTILCNGHPRSDTTDAFGSYLAVFPIGHCPLGQTVKVTAEKNGKSGVTSGTVQGITTKLNLAIVNVSIPEYGTIGALIAGGAGIGMIAYTRRRQGQMQF